MSEKDFAGLLRAFVQGEPFTAEKTDIREILRVAARQNLMPVLAYENKLRDFCEKPNVSEMLRHELTSALTVNINRVEAFEKLSARLTEQGIAHMPVKGYYLRELYPAPELRTFGDIDILIRPQDRQKTHELMLSLGYSPDKNWEPTWSYGKESPHFSEVYEIHTNLMDGNLDDRADFQGFFADAWDHAEPERGLRYRPERDFHFVYVLCHLAKHLYSGGAGIRMYLDIAFFIKRYDSLINWPAVEARFESLGLTDFFHTAMNACRLWFGVQTLCPLPEPDPAALDELLDYTLNADLFAHLRDKSVAELRGDNAANPSRSRLMLRKVFPPAAEIAPRYTFLRGRPWLLPAAWVVRLVKNAANIPASLSHLGEIKNTDISAVTAYDSFMKSIGL